MQIEIIRENLKIDCKNCCGLCCVAFYCAKSDGFPKDKLAGIPCMYLKKDHLCEIHSILASKHMKGCMSFDCLGAGQAVKRIYANKNWEDSSVSSKEMFEVFYHIKNIHQTIWYLLQAYEICESTSLRKNIETKMEVYIQLEKLSPEQILNFDVVNFQKEANIVLKSVSSTILAMFKRKFQKRKNFIGFDMTKENLRYMDFTMAYLMAANMKNCNLEKANFLGADLRDANIKGADLSKSIFLTQMQVNSCIGNKSTKLPKYIKYPEFWEK